MIVAWVASLIAAAWKLSQLYRAPRDRGLWVVAIAAAVVAVALTADLAQSAGLLGGGDEPFPGLGKYLENILLIWFFCALICLLRSETQTVVRRAAWFDVAAAALVSTGLTAIYFGSRAPVPWTFEGAGQSLPVLAFYLIGNLFMAYACAVGTMLLWRARSGMPGDISLSLSVAAAGLVVNFLGVHLVRVFSTGSRLIGLRGLPVALDRVTSVVLVVGITVFFSGLGYPGSRTALIKVRLWFVQRVRLQRLYPLWQELVEAFPAIALDEPPSAQWFDSLTVRRVRGRYYRRLIECRDGLVLISPYIVAPKLDTDNAPYSSREQAELLCEALQFRRRGDLPTGEAVAVAAPYNDTIEDDARQLLLLAGFIATIRNERTTTGAPLRSHADG